MRNDRRSFDAPELTSSVLSGLVARLYRHVHSRLRPLLMAVIWGLEGGQMRSATARRLLLEVHGVEVGAHSYGSLLVPGMAQPGTVVGRYVSIGPNVRRYNAQHPTGSASLHPYWYNPILGFADIELDVPRTSLVIGDDAWIGANVVILPGCQRIGVGAVVGAGAIVTRDVADFTIVAGVPARSMGTRLTRAKRDRLLSENPWSREPRECYEILREVERLDD